MSYEMVIGLEVHVQLKTQAKIFSPAATLYGQEPNTQVSFLDVALPGTLPVVNKQAIDMAVMFGLAVDATISKNSFFSRKNYFYPDLPKGYQISQSNNPIVQNGQLEITTNKGIKTIRIERAHLEEDAGKSVHDFIGDQTGLDYNRAGTPLLEIVTHPDFRSAEEVICYLKDLHQLVQHLGICDGNMQEGSFRCDVNLSIRKTGEDLGTRAELKNINSFRFIESAIHYEYQRQVNVLDKGGIITQETRLYDPDNNETRSMRSKENAFDYRYFPDPDLLPIILSNEEIESIHSQMPLLPKVRRETYAKALNVDEVNFLMDNPTVADYYDALAKNISAKTAYNWVAVELQAVFNRVQSTFDARRVPVHVLLELIACVDKDEVSLKSAKTVLQNYYDQPQAIQSIIDQLGVRQSNDLGFVESLVDEILAQNPQQVQDYRAGNKKLLSFFVGQIMKNSKGKANPKQVNEILNKKLNE
ncbi:MULTISPECIES: Asp-tRNA(Asn)/Glu-tRNA(Gln) amidotransferase subunit GatB [Cysteiniphilum]|uniref:Aspartyl/glutamyl-tRNA(Asn/Gln) amidotransferase subunit B n=1 Tax=Cysteiniphilum litorale TaxID=2056700 RepID=A0A8J3E803_9GAMM|nr:MULTISPECIES: Asp-tRNA(Asn)/Glu-tRNA(Gln) amidotransferase subunit GatB [Cysteiniphilum]GGF89636.1 aspartyl/glutamyl-tRNA(Asn/Gln) amidotransferase subunit B [Cysteiniphilum litorale]